MSCTCKVVVLLFKPIAFLPFSLLSLQKTECAAWLTDWLLLLGWLWPQADLLTDWTTDRRPTSGWMTVYISVLTAGLTCFRLRTLSPCFVFVKKRVRLDAFRPSFHVTLIRWPFYRKPADLKRSWKWIKTRTHTYCIRVDGRKYIIHTREN